LTRLPADETHPQIIDRILDAIREAKTICVVGHIRPDGDCIGSQLALTLALRAEGKNVVCWNQDSVPAKYRFLDPGKDF
jgi:phosphoesterase RecJ-like protein